MVYQFPLEDVVIPPHVVSKAKELNGDKSLQDKRTKGAKVISDWAASYNVVAI